MRKVITQIYGITDLRDALICAELGADHIGMAFGEVKHLGPTQKSSAEAKAIFEQIPDTVVKVGLTIAYDVDEIINDLNLYCPDVFHLSGDITNISPEGVQRIRDAFPDLKIMQALPVLAGVPLEEQPIMKLIEMYEDTTDFFLIDTKEPTSEIGIGATGSTHDWNIDKAIVEATKVPCIIAGGLDEHNVIDAIKVSKPYGVDSCTRTSYPLVEGFPGSDRKDPAKVKAFIEAALSVDLED
jgi:phosphoribosylanthranilate isomerase